MMDGGKTLQTSSSLELESGCLVGVKSVSICLKIYIMSHTATATSQAMVEWVRVFPKQATETYTSSVMFMKQLTIVAVSALSYMKNLLPEESYTVEQFGGLRLRIIKKKCRDELAQFVSTALAQAFEAFEKKYLHKLALCFYDGECNEDNLLEYYIFEYTYKGDEGVRVDVSAKGRDLDESKYTFENVQHNTVQLIRTCVVMMESANPMPDTYDVSLRLYYNDDAPEGYQAPGFAPPPGQWARLPRCVRVGRVHTRHHGLSAGLYLRPDTQDSHHAQPSQNAPVITQNEDDFDSQDISEERSETNSDSGNRVVCPCGKTDEPDEELMLTCDYCGSRQHAWCFGRLRRAARHCCARCADAGAGRGHADTRLALLNDKKRECLCILRRTLAWCCSLPAVGVSGLVDKFSLSFVNATKLIKLLQTNGVVEDTDIDIMSPRKIIQDQLRSVMSKYFYTEECDLVDRLLAETLSQGTTDPVRQVLGPMEAINLQNATKLGTIIEAPQQDTAMEDATLKQYKEVILSGEQNEEDLPLSGKHNPVKDIIGKKNGKRNARETRAGVKTKRAKTSA